MKYVRRHKRLFLRVALVIVTGLVVVIGVQVIYPTNKTLPNTTIHGVAAGGKTTEEASQIIQDTLATTTAELRTNVSTSEVKISDAGATVDGKALSEKVA
jgi:Rieske Fe-S protein